MPAHDDQELVVLNQRNRPVEVHVGRRVIRIAPLATATVPLAGDRDSAKRFQETIARLKAENIGGQRGRRPDRRADQR